MAAATSTASCCKARPDRPGAAGFVVQRAAGLEAGLLLQVAQMGGRMNGTRSGVRIVLAGQDSQQRGLAAAVGTDQADPIARAKLERDPLQHRLGAKPLFRSTTSRRIMPASAVMNLR